ncbi:MAG TPA: histidine kinase [Longimicrobium sp.]|nr:histidine kinase [Longimicrobium sp.]
MTPSPLPATDPRSPRADTGPYPPPDAAPVASAAWTARAALAAWFAVNLGMLAPDFRGAVLAGGRPATPALALLLAVPSSLVLAAAGWAAFRLTRRHAVGRRGLARSVAVHAAAALGFALLDVAVRAAERRLLADTGPGFAPARDAGELAGVGMVYALLAVIAHAVEYARRYRERRLAGLRLQASLARAELERASAELRVLKLQLTPHFLFNSLHAASALVRQAPDAAERIVVRLADLLRHATAREGTQEVPLDDELRTLAAFLEVEEIRLGGRLRVAWAIDDAARTGWVPHMLLQPLAENAVKHGLAKREGGGCVRVAARRRGEWLELEVRDDGVGLAAAACRSAAGAGAGIGTTNTRARLAGLYGDRQQMEIATAGGGGTRVSLRLPWHQAPWPAHALAGAAAEAPARPRGRRWPARAASATLFLLLWRQAFMGMRGQRLLPDRVVGAAEAATCGMLSAAALTLLACAAFVLARRAPAAGAPGAVRRHVRAALLLGAGVALERHACAVAWGTPARLLATPAALGAIAAEAAAWMGVYGAVSLVAHALEYARRAQAGEAAELRLQASLARAELERTAAELRGLQMRVNPGFLFAALAAVAARIRPAPADAERMVVRLADLLRRAMVDTGTDEVSLEEEMTALEPFLEVERIRLGERLRLEWRVDDEALDALVPSALLQPLVAEAVDGAAAGCPGGAALAVAARRRGGWLELEVCGCTAGGPAAAETRARLARLYGDRCAVEVAAAPEGGSRAVLRLPWHDEPWLAAAAPRSEAAVP